MLGVIEESILGMKMVKAFSRQEEAKENFNGINESGQTLLMVTHSVKAASHAGRVLFIKDGEVFHQLYRGEGTDQDFYQRITDTLNLLMTGGGSRA